MKGSLAVVVMDANPDALHSDSVEFRIRCIERGSSTMLKGEILEQNMLMMVSDIRNSYL